MPPKKAVKAELPKLPGVSEKELQAAKAKLASAEEMKKARSNMNYYLKMTPGAADAYSKAPKHEKMHFWTIGLRTV